MVIKKINLVLSFFKIYFKLVLPINFGLTTLSVSDVSYTTVNVDSDLLYTWQKVQWHHHHHNHPHHNFHHCCCHPQKNAWTMEETQIFQTYHSEPNRV